MQNIGALAAHVRQVVTTLAEAWRVTRADGQVFGWTSHDQSVTIDGVVYRASEGLAMTAAHTSNDLRVDTLDVTVFLDVSTEAEIYAGVWDAAAVTIFLYDWQNPPLDLSADVRVIRQGTVGELTRTANAFTAQIPGLLQALNIRIGRQYTATCPWRHAQWNGTTYESSVECGVDLAPFIDDGTIDSIGVDATRSFGDALNPHAADPIWYPDGLITMLTGTNAGLTREIGTWDANIFLLKRPFPYAVVVGDTYRAVRGDNKTFAICKIVYDNVVHFGGFPDVPGQDRVFTNPTAV